MVCKMKNCFKLTFAILVLLLLCVGCDMGGNSEKMQPESNTEEKQKEERNVLIDNGYLSIQTVDKVPGLHRGFSIAVINISIILPVLDTKKFLTYQL